MRGDETLELDKTGAGVSAAAHFRAAAGHLGHTLLDLVFPPGCLSCRRAVAMHGALCAACWNEVRFIERPFCDRLGTPFSADLGAEGLLSPEAIANPPVYARARAVARFEDGPVRHLIHRLKYGDRIELAGPLGRHMARAGHELLAGADILVPIPLHRHRLIWRRFNQANALAEVISKESSVPADPFLITRTKATPSQVGLTRTQRAENMHGAFTVPEAEKIKIEGRALVLIDDVLTSGATLNAAARVLLRAGAARVDALVFARVVTGA
jgi:ComF family protein